MDCRTALQLLKLGRLPEDFIEGMICPEGCVGGPSRHVAVKELTKARETLLSKADSRNILDNLKNYPMGELSLIRDGFRVQ